MWFLTTLNRVGPFHVHRVALFGRSRQSQIRFVWRDSLPLFVWGFDPIFTLRTAAAVWPSECEGCGRGGNGVIPVLCHHTTNYLALERSLSDLCVQRKSLHSQEAIWREIAYRGKHALWPHLDSFGQIEWPNRMDLRYLRLRKKEFLNLGVMEMKNGPFQ